MRADWNTMINCIKLPIKCIKDKEEQIKWILIWDLVSRDILLSPT
jgi:hypothetical protein